MKKYVYLFTPQGAEGTKEMKDVLGGKGAGLAEMSNLGISVPPGLTIITDAFVEYFNDGGKLPEGLWEEVAQGVVKIEANMGAKFGDPSNPILFSIRSGARASMPGMMDTVLNLGLNDEIVKGVAKATNNERFAYDSYRRFINMFSDVVLGVDHEHFEKILIEKKKSLGVTDDTGLNAEHLKELVVSYKNLVKKEKNIEFPTDPWEQLRMAIRAVFDSWNNQRAITYRKLYSIPDNWGTAVNVQAMVFGNMGDSSGTGVAFTRNPSTGEKKFFGEFLINAQGEDVVAGIRTPRPISELEKEMPAVYQELVAIYQKLENHYKDMQDIEFTIQNKKLFILQTRNGKRTAAAGVRIAVEMVSEKLIDKNTAINRINPAELDQLLHPTINPKSKAVCIAKGMPASPGAAVGKVVFTADDAQKMVDKGEKVVLVREVTSPDDIGGMNVSQGILTVQGGMTSHAAVVARGMGKCCITGCAEIKINIKKKEFSVNKNLIKEGDIITLDGSSGKVYLGKEKLIQPELSGNFIRMMEWADEIRKLKVRTNADTPHDCMVARDFGAEGIGLCRTEHMFFSGDRIKAVREMIISDTQEQRKIALSKILPMQKGDFKEIFKVMNGLPVTIRLLDPPLHEFLPHTQAEIEELSADMGISFETLSSKVNSLGELNPMLGHRGCRLGITFPEIYEMQTQAIFEAAGELVKEGKEIIPEVMIPLVSDVKELQVTRALVEKTAKEVMAKMKVNIKYLIGTMIELPRAALTADKIVTEADFFSFGTNDLTQTVYGLSRDDSAHFLPYYIEHKVFPQDPFVSVDQEGVGELMRIAISKGRKVKPELKIGICGEHGGEPVTVDFCHEIGLNYVSCSPYRVPIARLAAAQAVLKRQ